jgi:hypothetical protein
MSKGHKYTLVYASIAKWCLRGEMPPEMRLEFLSHLDKMVDPILTPQVIAMVEPICDKGLQIVTEAKKLGPSKSLDVFADKFEVFCALNPSLRAAYDEACRPWAKVFSISA